MWMFITLIVCTIGCLIAIVVAGQLTYNKNEKYFSEQKLIINSMVELVNTRTKAINTALSNYINWLGTDYNTLSLELFLTDTFLIKLKDKYGITDTEYALAFQNIISEVQNLNRRKTQSLLTEVSNEMIEAVKNQIKEK